MSKPVRFLMVGGFLGAGKTTTIAQLARHYTDQGLRVGLVTNDQAYNLVDTHFLRSEGFDVGEVPGACFCCKFDDLMQTVDGLSADGAPDVIIAEPVGSCTDLMATVVEPLRHLFQDRFEIGPLAVLLKPEHGQKILRGDDQVGFSPKAAYIFLKQIEEADIVAINKIDKLTDQEQQELVELVQERFPSKQVLSMSARHGNRFDEFVSSMKDTPAQHIAFMDLDYDVYAEGEAELGWLNCQVEVVGREGSFELDAVLLDLLSDLQAACAKRQAEAAHLKILGQSGDSSAIVNLVGGGAAAELSLESGVSTDQAELVVNARVATDPELLEAVVRYAVQHWAQRHDLNHQIDGMQRFRPGRPQPTHSQRSKS